uniref:LAGLIDADG endonuclease n=1 Tax=Fusarium brasilicum TaxID=281087 RepID=UPI0020280139|nr:LAGLIDADG endonuclease [Fusarium brasilicum]UPX01610.1 LAGLIDADG endonuclease [Fusarium brasilicum]UPX01662.1 LAGLIDADG endonuclease [Fusarium brasilicum]
MNRASTSNIQSLKRVSDLRKVNSYPFKVPGTFIRNYSTTRVMSLHPWFVTGFTDAEGCFWIGVRNDPRNKTGWCVQAFFQIALHKKDVALLNNIQSYFGEIGTVAVRGDRCYFIVSSLKQIIKVIIPHFDAHPLITNKLVDYRLWKSIISIMEAKRHLTVEGLNEIIRMKSSLNLGLSDEIQDAFAETLSTNPNQERSWNPAESIPHGMWMAGFTSGEGSFFVNIFKSTHHRVGYQVRLGFEIAQHIRDELTMATFTSFFNCGIISRYSEDMVKYRCTKFSDLNTLIIPFFKEYLPLGNKLLDFEDFGKVALLLDNKAHLTEEGLNGIRKIKAVACLMNSLRK